MLEIWDIVLFNMFTCIDMLTQYFFILIYIIDYEGDAYQVNS